MEGEGLVSGKKTVLYCVITRLEVNTLKNIVNSLDSSSFVAVSDVSEIIGTHIKKVDKATLRRRRPKMTYEIPPEGPEKQNRLR